MRRRAVLMLLASLIVVGCGAGGFFGYFSGKPKITPIAPEGGPPVTAPELLAWLKAGNYSQWVAEAAPHESDGPHGTVRTFLNPSLAASMVAESENHPVGATSVKELYEDATLTGWAVSIKVDAKATDDNGWYWYETFSTKDGVEPDYDGVGIGTCTGCHEAGLDYVRISYPFE